MRGKEKKQKPMIKHTIKYSLFLLSLVIVFPACQSSRKKDGEEGGAKKSSSGILSGELNVLVDETILPVVLEHKELFEASYPNSSLNIIADNENMAIHRLINREADFAILTRELSEKESESFERRSVKPRVFSAAKEGLVFFSNIGDSISQISPEDIHQLLRGQSSGLLVSKLFFENINSSIFRQLKNIFDIEKVSGSKVAEIKGIDEMVEQVLSTENSIGVVSYDEMRTMLKSFSDIEKIRILDIENSIGDEADGVFYAPTQSNFALEKYPFMRDIYVLNYQPKMALGIGWSSFITGDRGQRVFLKAGMLPATMPGREIIIRDRVE